MHHDSDFRTHLRAVKALHNQELALSRDNAALRAPAPPRLSCVKAGFGRASGSDSRSVKVLKYIFDVIVDQEGSGLHEELRTVASRPRGRGFVLVDAARYKPGRRVSQQQSPGLQGSALTYFRTLFARHEENRQVILNATTRTLNLQRTTLPNGRAWYQDPAGLFRRGNRSRLSDIESQKKVAKSAATTSEKLLALLDSSPRMGQPGAGLCFWVTDTVFRIEHKSRFAREAM